MTCASQWLKIADDLLLLLLHLCFGVAQLHKSTLDTYKRKWEKKIIFSLLIHSNPFWFLFPLYYKSLGYFQFGVVGVVLVVCLLFIHRVLFDSRPSSQWTMFPFFFFALALCLCAFHDYFFATIAEATANQISLHILNFFLLFSFIVYYMYIAPGTAAVHISVPRIFFVLLISLSSLVLFVNGT